MPNTKLCSMMMIVKMYVHALINGLINKLDAHDK